MGQLDSIRSANRDVGNATPGPFQDCRECVHIAMFFDGTGNNRFADDEAQKWSNVARLFFAARDEPENAVYPIYIAGVGTRYNASANWAERVDSWVEDNTLGNAGGLGGERRLQGGDRQMSDALERVLLQNARVEGGKAKQTAERMQGEGFARMSQSLGNHQLIKSINFSVFGFSRGAALARAFVNRLAAQMKAGGARRLHLPGQAGTHQLPGHLRHRGVVRLAGRELGWMAAQGAEHSAAGGALLSPCRRTRGAVLISGGFNSQPENEQSRRAGVPGGALRCRRWL
jgi:hypothetical protein